MRPAGQAALTAALLLRAVETPGDAPIVVSATRHRKISKTSNNPNKLPELDDTCNVLGLGDFSQVEATEYGVTLQVIERMQGFKPNVAKYSQDKLTKNKELVTDSQPEGDLVLVGWVPDKEDGHKLRPIYIYDIPRIYVIGTDGQYELDDRGNKQRDKLSDGTTGGFLGSVDVTCQLAKECGISEVLVLNSKTYVPKNKAVLEMQRPDVPIAGVGTSLIAELRGLSSSPVAINQIVAELAALEKKIDERTTFAVVVTVESSQGLEDIMVVHCSTRREAKDTLFSLQGQLSGIDSDNVTQTSLRIVEEPKKQYTLT